MNLNAEEDSFIEAQKVSCIERFCSLAIFIISIWSFIVTFVGIILAYANKPALIEHANQIGAGAKDIVDASDLADVLLISVLSVNGAALIPIILSLDGCQTACFGYVNEGCCGRVTSCFQVCLGLWLTRAIELLLFLSMVLMTGVSYVFVFGYTMAEFLKNICETGASAIEPAMLLIERVSMANSTAHYSFLKELNLETYCAAGSVGEADNTATLLLILGCMLTVLAQPLTLASIARAKESIRTEIAGARETARASHASIVLA